IKVKLPIFWYTEEQIERKDKGEDISLSEVGNKNIMFYHITGMTAYYDGENEYTEILANGDEFICPLTPAEVDRRIMQSKL
ncbi:hypothetical protein ACO1MG_13850, partial [Staphylococcus aureus]